MKTRIILISTVFAACSSAVSPSPAPAPLVTDASEYRFVEADGYAPSARAMEMQVGFTFTNLTGTDVSFCSLIPRFERWVANEWVRDWEMPVFADVCDSSLEGVWQYRNVVRRVVFDPESRYSSSPPVTGTYRLVLDGEVSNSFEIIAPTWLP